MNKHELKSLLENIYTTLTEEDQWHPPLLLPPEPVNPMLPPIPLAPPLGFNRRPPKADPWLSPLAPPKPPPGPTWLPRPQGTPDELNSAIQWADDLIGENGTLWGPGPHQKPGWTIPIGGHNLNLQQYRDWILGTWREALQQQQQN